MKALIRGGVGAVFVILGGAALAEPLPMPAPIDRGAIRVADTDDFAAKRDAYLEKAKGEFRSWQDRLSRWTDEAKANSGQFKDEARANVDKAWVLVKADWRKLQAAAPEGWDKARAAYEAASARLKSAWEKIEPQG